jgi:hypothetical protein
MQISLFQRYKAYINSLSIGETYTTDDLYKNVGCHESSTWWKKLNKQRMYRTSTYQTYLKRLGALENVKRGTWKVLHHIPEWFYSKHMNYLLGYSDRSSAESLAVLEAMGCPKEAMQSIYIPESQRTNPFKLTSLQTVSSPSKAINSIIKSESQITNTNNSTKAGNSETVSIDVRLLKKLYDGASQDMKDRLRKEYAPHFETFYDFGDSLELSTSRFAGPLMIAKGLAEMGYEKKCLVVACNYELHTKISGENTFLYFIEK